MWQTRIQAFSLISASRQPSRQTPDYILVLAASDDEQTAQQYYEDAVGSDSAWADRDAGAQAASVSLSCFRAPLSFWQRSLALCSVPPASVQPMSGLLPQEGSLLRRPEASLSPSAFHA